MGRQKTARAYVGLGGNIGDRLATLRSAVHQLHRHGAFTVAGASPVLETSPLGPSSEPFLNAAVELRTSVTAKETLSILHEVERAHGRTRRIRWEARTLDLDLLLFFAPDETAPLQWDDTELTLPHPRIGQRDFVLQPLVALLPELVLGDATFQARLEQLPPDARTVLRTLDATLLDPMGQPIVAPPGHPTNEREPA